jgi:hypothetical protein
LASGTSGQFFWFLRAGDALAELRVLEGGGVERARQADHRVEVRSHADGEARGTHPFLAEGSHGDEPAVPLAPEAVRRRHPGAVEEHFAEHLLAGDVPDRPDPDSVDVEVDDQRRDALVFRAALESRGIGADEEEPPLRDVRARDPDLVAVYHVVVAVAERGGAQVGEIATGLGLGEALAPVVVGIQDVRDPEPLLLLRAPLDDHRSDLPQAVGVVDAGRAVRRHHLRVDHVLGDRGVAPAPLRRPVDRRPAALVELPLPGPPALHRPHDPRGAGGAVALVVRRPLLQERGKALGEPLHELVAERLVLLGVGEVHTGIVLRFDPAAARNVAGGPVGETL